MCLIVGLPSKRIASDEMQSVHCQNLGVSTTRFASSAPPSLRCCSGSESDPRQTLGSAAPGSQVTGDHSLDFTATVEEGRPTAGEQTAQAHHQHSLREDAASRPSRDSDNVR